MISKNMEVYSGSDLPLISLKYLTLTVVLLDCLTSWSGLFLCLKKIYKFLWCLESEEGNAPS